MSNSTAGPSSTRTSWFATLQRKLKGRFVKNLAALYAADGLNYLFPLMLLPFLTRRLGPDAWGRVVMIQSFCQITVMMVDYGFAYTGSRDVARHRDDPQKLSQIVGGVSGARLFLTLLSGLLLMAGCCVIPHMRDQLGLVCWGYLAAWLPTLSLQWFYQGMERMQVFARLELINKALSAAVIFATVRSEADCWLVFAGQAVGSLAMLLVTVRWISREIPLRLPNLALVKDALRSGWHMFVYCSAGTLLGQASNLVLGLVGSTRALAYYSSAERVNRIFTAGLAPVHKALFPRMSHMTAHSPREAAIFLRRMAYFLVGIGALTGLGFFVFADWLVKTLLGSGFTETVGVVRIFALVPPLMSLSYILGVQWLLPLGHERILHRVVIASGLCGLTLAYFLGRRWEHIGMAWAVVAAKALECTLYVLLARNLTSSSTSTQTATAAS